MNFIAAVTLQMALTTTVGIFRPITIGFQGEHTSSGFKFRGMGIGQFPGGFCKTFISRHKSLRGKKEWQTDCFTHSDMEQLFSNIIFL